MAQNDQQYETINEAALRCGVSRDTLRRRIADGTLPAQRLGPRLIRLRVTDVDSMLRPIPNARTPREAA